MQADLIIVGAGMVGSALALALDRPSMIRGLFGGMAEEAWGFFPPRLAHGMDIRQELSIPSDHTSTLRKAAVCWA